MIKTLVKNSNGRWCIVQETLTCGNMIYAYIEGKGWLLGRIEHSDRLGGYYFLCETQKIQVPLSEQIEVRTVEEQKELENACTISEGIWEKLGLQLITLAKASNVDLLKLKLTSEQDLKVVNTLMPNYPENTLASIFGEAVHILTE